MNWQPDGVVRGSDSVVTNSGAGFPVFAVIDAAGDGVQATLTENKSTVPGRTTGKRIY